jgi:hypothetical protein
MMMRNKKKKLKIVSKEKLKMIRKMLKKKKKSGLNKMTASNTN